VDKPIFPLRSERGERRIFREIWKEYLDEITEDFMHT